MPGPRLAPLPRQTLDRVYRFLAAEIGLSAPARQDLIVARQFHTALDTGIYFSLPSARSQNSAVSDRAIAEFGIDIIERVPGFTFLCKQCDGRGIAREKACEACGGLGKGPPRFRSARGERHDYVAIACDEHGHAFWGYSRKLPFNPAADHAKYMLLSSSRGGEPSVAGLPKYHVAGRQFRANEVWITEGIIKAEVVAARLQTRVIGIYSTSVDGPTEDAVKRLIEGWSCAS